MEFASDNTSGVHETIMHAIRKANEGWATAYGSDDLSKRAEAELGKLFEHEVRAFLVLNGTGANALAVCAITAPYGYVLCHREAHLYTDECGAPEMFSGAKLLGLGGAGCRIAASELQQTLAGLVRGEHENKPMAVSISQASELGTVYSVAEIKAISEIARAHRLKLHMDGSRFANALAGLDCQPAELSWKAGVDVLSFGATKNGALAVEAVIFFDTELARDFLYRRKRGAQHLSKGRFLGAQMLGYLQGGLWLKNAQHANRMAALLADKLAQLRRLRLPLPTQANEVFVILPRHMHEALIANGAHYHEWPGEGPGTDTVAKDEVFVRFVTSFQTTEDQVATLVRLVEQVSA
jgi:threonine aldolase